MVTGPDNAVYVAGRDAIYRYVPGGAVTSYEAPSPRYLVSGPDDAVWFTSDWEGGAIGRMTVSGEVTIHKLPGAITGPMGLVVGPDHAIYAGLSNAGAIARISPGSGQVTVEPVPDPQQRRPGDGGPMPNRLIVGPDGAVWFTDPGDDSVGRKAINGQISEITIPPLSRAEQAYPETPLSLAITDAVPTAIATGPGGLLFVTESDAKSIATIDPNGTPAQPASPMRKQAVSKVARGKRCARHSAPRTRHRVRSSFRTRLACRRARQ
jgi:virginiamycin B lyase